MNWKSRVPWDRQEVVLFSCFGLAMTFLYFSHVIWVTEFSQKFFRLINYHLIHQHEYREILYLVQLPAYLSLDWTEDLEWLKFLYSIPCLLIPILSLSISWVLVRKSHPHLFIWAALSIMLGHIYGQHQIDSEHVMMAQLTWPYLLGLAVLKGRVRNGWLLFFTFLLFFTHPASIIAFILAAGALYRLSKSKIDLRQQNTDKFIALFLIGLSVIRFLMISWQSYDDAALKRYLGNGPVNLLYQLWTFIGDNSYLPLMNLLALWILGVCIFLIHKGVAGFKREKIIQKLIPACVIIVLLSYVVPLYFMERGTDSWVLHYRICSLLSLPFYSMAIMEFTFSMADSFFRLQFRKKIYPWIGLCYLLSMMAFSWKWHMVDVQVSDELDRTQNQKCVPVESLTSLPSPLKRYFATPLYFLLKRGRRPASILWFKKDCENFEKYGFLGFTDSYSYLMPWEKNPEDMYFNFELLLDYFIKKQNQPKK